jgi:Tfp pilus assembly protein PilX
MKQQRTINQEQGMILVLVMVVISALLIIGLSMLSESTSQYVLTSAIATNNNALYTAEAGVEQSIDQLNSNDNFGGYPSPQTFFDNANQGFGTFVATITPAPGNTNAKVITSTGRIYKHSDHNALISTRTVQVTTVGTTSSGYSVQTGPGGLILGGSASIGNSAVYVEGTISMSGTTAIGTSSKPVNVFAANKACLSSDGSTYPVLCTSSQPISFPNYSSARIYGPVCATGQTQSKFPDSPYNTSAIQIPDLQAGCTAPDVSQPTYNKQAQVNAVASTSTSNTTPYKCNGSNTIVYPANLELTGNVNMGSGCTYYIKGNIYITGNLTINGSARVYVDDSLGSTRPTVLVDGTIDVGGSASIIPNSANTSAYLISWASNAACGSSCTTITGAALKNTSTYKTVTVEGGASVPGGIFQAYWGEVYISGSGNIGSAAGLTVDLQGGSLTFGTILSSGVSTWTMSSYQILYP